MSKQIQTLLLLLLYVGAAGCTEEAVTADSGVLDGAVHDQLRLDQDQIDQGGDGLGPLVCSPGAELLARVDPARMLVDLNALVGLGERLSPEGQARAAAYLREELSLLPGWQIRDQSYSRLGKTFVNIEATLLGSELPAQFTMGCAHYDSTSSDPTDAPGADDNASGTVAMLETARVLAGCQLRQSVRLVFFSNEEIGIVGATQYVQEMKGTLTPQQVTGVINADMVGFAAAGEDLDLATRPAYKILADKMKEAVERYTSLPVKEIVNDQCG